jgi:hypothetical protein
VEGLPVKDLLNAAATPLAIAGMLGLAVAEIILAPGHPIVLAGNVVSALAGWLSHRTSSPQS